MMNDMDEDYVLCDACMHGSGLCCPECHTVPCVCEEDEQV